MNIKPLIVTAASLFLACASTAFACEHIAGETKFLDYANCRYGEDAIEMVQLPENSVWEQCIYLMEAFRPPQLLAVTKENNGKEQFSTSDRSQIGNPCYLTKQSCDDALKAAGLN